MLRTFRTADLPAYYELMIGEFPDENRLLGWRREPFFRILRRLDRLDFRIVLGFLNAIGRPLFRVFVIEADGELAASALESFGEVSAYVGSVVVAPKYRRRGLARQILAACHASAQRRKKRYVVLDVVDANAGAYALYESLGYRPVGHGAQYVRSTDTTPPATSAPHHLRPFRRADGAELAEIARGTVSDARQAVHPVAPSEFRVPSAVVQALDSRTDAWVVDPGQGPVAWLRASVSPAMECGHLTAPVIGPSAEPADVQALLGTAIDWARAQGSTRVVSEVWDENTRAVAALRTAGFEVAYGVRTLALPLPKS